MINRFQCSYLLLCLPSSIPLHKAIVGLCKNNIKAEVHSLIVEIRTKTMAQLIEVVVEDEEVLAELKKNPSHVETTPLAAAGKDSTAKGKGTKDVFSTIRNKKKEIFNV